MDKKVTWIDTGLVALKGDAFFKEINAELGEYRLPVEPLSSKTTISRFIREGGLGYYSLTEGTLGSRIFQMTASFDETSFAYGSVYKTLYNAGYPLHRVFEGPLFSAEISQKIGPVEKVVLPVNLRKDTGVSFEDIPIERLYIPDHASNVFYMNTYCAKIMGFEGQGMVTTYPESISADNILRNTACKNRFIEEHIPVDHHKMKWFLMRSRLQEIFKVFDETAEGVFFALCVHNGILLLISGKRRQLDTVVEKLRQIPLTFELKSGLE